jgi:hypothetical protein
MSFPLRFFGKEILTNNEQPAWNTVVGLWKNIIKSPKEIPRKNVI